MNKRIILFATVFTLFVSAFVLGNTNMVSASENTDKISGLLSELWNTVTAILDEESTTAGTVNSTSPIVLTIRQQGKTYNYTLGTKSSYKLPTTHREFIEQFPQLNREGYVFKGLYDGKKKVKKIKKNTTLTAQWRSLTTRITGASVKKGKIKLTYNNKDYKYIDGMKISYSLDKKFKKGVKSFTVKTFEDCTVGDGRGDYGYVPYYMEEKSNNVYEWFTAKNGVTLYYVTSTSGDLRNVPTPNPSKPETYDGVIKAGQTGAFSPTFCKERGLRYLAIKIVGYKNGKPVMYYSEHIGLDAGIIGTSVAIK